MYLHHCLEYLSLQCNVCFCTNFVLYLSKLIHYLGENNNFSLKSTIFKARKTHVTQIVRVILFHQLFKYRGLTLVNNPQCLIIQTTDCLIGLTSNIVFDWGSINNFIKVFFYLRYKPFDSASLSVNFLWVFL